MISKNVILACLGGLFFLNGCSRTNHPADVEYDQRISPYHRVSKGESISSIAQKFGMDKTEFVRLNGLKPPYKIFVGQKVLVKTSVPLITEREEGFDTVASNIPETKGDVEVASLDPLKGTEPVSRDQFPLDDKTFPQETAYNDTDIEDHDRNQEPSRDKDIPVISTKSYQWPVKGRIIKGFSSGKNGNDGINIIAPKGTPVVAANVGVVAHAGNQVAGLGNMVLMKHPNGQMTIYTHLDDIKVKKGQQINKGDKIGTVGKTGNVKEPQLHFEIRNGKTPIDPTQYLN